MILPLRDLSEFEDELDIRLRFKYFQNIEGELALTELSAGSDPDRCCGHRTGVQADQRGLRLGSRPRVVRLNPVGAGQ